MCPTCGGTNLDDYGCLDCMLDSALEDLFEEDDDWEDPR